VTYVQASEQVSATASPRSWRSLLVPSASALAAIAVVAAGFRENHYLTHVRGMAPELQPYPIKEVVFIIGLMAIEALIVTALIHWTGREGSWQRALAAAAVCVGFVAIALAGSMHISPSWKTFVLWTIVMLAWMAGLAAFRALRRRNHS
jgi:hypothetical protein